eukprot:TRINITY_DN1770_c0_g1_i2.p1 TRINITY_DN1770_c0_g1~~TRINITY_DN1770_c0_g1_i2.p1  ORF type:complete len:172 (+),score=9.51 TRINITY_DN1770_c0_g1_i2:172-687(+)
MDYTMAYPWAQLPCANGSTRSAVARGFGIATPHIPEPRGTPFPNSRGVLPISSSYGRHGQLSEFAIASSVSSRREVSDSRFRVSVGNNIRRGNETSQQLQTCQPSKFMRLPDGPCNLRTSSKSETVPAGVSGGLSVESVLGFAKAFGRGVLLLLASALIPLACCQVGLHSS